MRKRHLRMQNPQSKWWSWLNFVQICKNTLEHPAKIHYYKLACFPSLLSVYTIHSKKNKLIPTEIDKNLVRILKTTLLTLTCNFLPQFQAHSSVVQVFLKTTSTSHDYELKMTNYNFTRLSNWVSAVNLFVRRRASECAGFDDKSQVSRALSRL